MSFFGSMMGSLAARAVVPLIGVAGFGAYKSGALNELPLPGVTKAPSHYEVQARVVSVEEACRLRYRVNGRLRQTEPVECRRAVEMLQRPDFVGYTVHKSEQVQYSYYTLDGTATLIGTMPTNKDAKGRRYRKNDVINIRVDAQDPSRSEVI